MGLETQLSEEVGAQTQMQLCDMIETMINPHQLSQTERSKNGKKDG